MTYALDAMVRRGAMALLWMAAAGAVAESARAQSAGSSGEVRSRRDTLVVRLNSRTPEQLRIRARIEDLISRYNETPMSPADRARLSATIDSLVWTFGSLIRGSAEASARIAGSVARSLVEAQAARAPRAQIEVLRGDLPPDEPVFKGWIGINAEGLQMPPRIRDGKVFLQYIEYPKILTVDANSPAARAGIMKGDLLVAYDGEDLREHEINLTELLQPSNRIRVTVDREGERHDYPLVVAMAPPALLARRLESGIIQLDDSSPSPVVRAYGMSRRGGAGGRASTPEARRVPLPPDGVEGGLMPMPAPRTFIYRRIGDALAGAQMAVVDRELGESFGVDAGVLLTFVGDPSPARNSGLRSGDVIVRANGEDVTSVAQLKRIIVGANDERHVELRVVRHKRPETLMLRW